jgi:hypothetical protein
MPSFFNKNKFLFDILAFVVFAGGSVMYWFDYAGPGKKKIHLISAIVFALLAVLKFVDVMEHIRGNKTGAEKK